MKEISNLSELIETIKFLHIECNKLCKVKFRKYFNNAGNVGVFCQSEEEYETLRQIQSELVHKSNEINRKYFQLKDPIIFPKTEDIPLTEYNYLYIRKVDETPYGLNRGDIDFYDDELYNTLMEEASARKDPRVVLSEQPGVGTMIQISDLETKALAYISKQSMTELIRFRH